jgi:uncharacterized protein
MRGALGRLADHVIGAGSIAGPGADRAARDLVLRHAPRVAGMEPGAPLVAAGEAPLDAARRIVLGLESSVLPIQGPPGTGKTYTGARMIVELVRAGRQVGVTAQSHRVITNLLDAVARAATAEGIAVRIGQRCDSPDGASTDPSVERISVSDAVAPGLVADRWDVVGGTSWLWAREDLAGAVGVLFVDEAGQVSLATVCSMAGAADSVVLLGDPNQLPQVSQGTHPEGAAASAHEHLVGDAKTIAPDRGLFLGTTYRLHPDVNAFISDAFYEGRLGTDPANERQLIAPGEPVGGTGVRFQPRSHTGNGNRSRDEAAWIAEVIAGLEGRSWTDRDGVTRPLAVEDVLVVAPYNAQVVEIAHQVERRLGRRPNVGTVDMFQGREAPVAIYSMTTSAPEDAPRDLEFLYSGNRLNVAMSRARGLAVLVASPALLRVACRTPEQIRLVNALCRLVEIAELQQAGLAAMPPPTAGGARPAERYEPLELGLA